MTINKKKITDEVYSDWVVTKLNDTKFVQSYSSNILSKPEYVLNITNENDKVPLYSTEQMIEMFRLGFLSMSKTDFGKNAISNSKVRLPYNPYNMIRNMDVGDKVIVPYSFWGAARTAASRLHKQFGAKYTVQKTSRTGETGDIEITRLK